MGAGAGGGREGRRGEEREGARQGGGEDGLRGGVRGVTSARKRSVASLLAARYHSTCIAAQVRVGVYRSSAARAGRGGRVCGARGRAGGCVRAVGGGRWVVGGGRRACWTTRSGSVLRLAAPKGATSGCGGRSTSSEEESRASATTAAWCALGSTPGRGATCCRSCCSCE